jgi:hypothetical protein
MSIYTGAFKALNAPPLIENDKIFIFAVSSKNTDVLLKLVEVSDTEKIQGLL